MTKSSKAEEEPRTPMTKLDGTDDPLAWRPPWCISCSRVASAQDREVMRSDKISARSEDEENERSPKVKFLDESRIDGLKDALETQQNRGLKQVTQVLKAQSEHLEKCLVDIRWQGENFQEKNKQMISDIKSLFVDFLGRIEQRWQQEDEASQNRAAAAGKKELILSEMAKKGMDGKVAPDPKLIVTGQVVDGVAALPLPQEKAIDGDGWQGKIGGMVFDQVPLPPEEDGDKDKKDKKEKKEKKEEKDKDKDKEKKDKKDKKEKKEEKDKEKDVEPDTPASISDPDFPSDKIERKRRKSTSSLMSDDNDGKMGVASMSSVGTDGPERRRRRSITSVSSVESEVRPPKEKKMAKELKLEREDNDTSLYLVAEKADLDDLVTQELAKWNFSDKWKERLANTDNPWNRRVNSKYFKLIANLVILTNVVFIAIQAEHSVAKAHEGEGPSSLFFLVDLGFCVFFFFEILLRLIGERIVFFLGQDWRWNVMDISFVAMDVMNQLFLLVLQGVDLSYMSSLRTGLKMVRLARAARALRMFRIVRSSTRCRLLIEETVASMSLGFWLLTLLCVVLTFFGIFFMQASADVLLSDSYEQSLQDRVIDEFGTSPEAVFSLFQLTLGGMSWAQTFENFSQVDSVYGIVFIVFVFFTFLLFMNVVTGVFVDSALQRSKRHEVENSSDEATQIRSLLRKADLDNAEGLVSKQDFLKFLNTPYGKEQLRSLGLGNSEALAIYELLEKDGSHRVNIDELASGCARFTQPVRSVDSVAVLLSVRKMTKEQRMFASFVQNRFAAMNDMIELSVGSGV